MLDERWQRYFPAFLTQQRKRTTSCQAEDDDWRVRIRWQQSKKVDKMSYQGVMAKAPPCPERTLKTPMPQQSSPSSRDGESQWVAEEDRRRRRVAFEETAGGFLTYLEDSEDLKVSVTELQEHLGLSEEASISIKQVTRQARNENGQNFLKFSGKEKERYAVPAGPHGTRSENVWRSWEKVSEYEAVSGLSE